MNANTDVLAQLNRMDSLRRRDYRENLRFYYGQQWPPQRSNQARRRLVFNYAKTIIEKVTSYLMLGRTITADPADESPAAERAATETTAYLSAVDEDQDLALLDLDTELDCAILGDGAYKVTWDPQDKKPIVTAPDVTGLYAWWQPDNLQRVWRVASQYSLDPSQVSDLYGLTMDQRQPNQRLTEVWTAERFTLYLGNEALQDQANPYGFIPLVLYPNLRKPHQFWGESDITNIRQSVEELNRAMSQLSAILEVSGNPIAVLEGINEAKDIAIEPGAVWEIPPEAKAYVLDLLQHGGMALHMQYIDVLYRTLHDLGESPRTAFGGSASPNIAALAMQLDLDPIIKKVRRKQLIRTVAYKKRAELILRLANLHTGSHHWPAKIRVNWAPIMPQDRARDAETDAILVDRGIISRQSAAQRQQIQQTAAELDQWIEETTRVSATNPPHQRVPSISRDPISPP